MFWRSASSDSCSAAMYSSHSRLVLQLDSHAERGGQDLAQVRALEVLGVPNEGRPLIERLEEQISASWNLRLHRMLS